MTNQPEALRLADQLDLYAKGDDHQQDTEEAAAELRRLHALNQELLEALKALMCDHGGSRAVSSDDDRAIKARAALEQPAQDEPVAWANPNDLQNFDMKVRTNGGPLHTVPLYTRPQEREWQGLTFEDKKRVLDNDFGGNRADCMDAAEKILREKNQ